MQTGLRGQNQSGIRLVYYELKSKGNAVEPRPLNARFWRVVWHGLKKYKVVLSVITAGVIGFLVWYLLAHEPQNIEAWLTFVERIALVLTLLAAFLLWLRELDKDWEDSLPKRLTVKFTMSDPNKPLMECHEAYLAHEADIRNWGQQIGQQMNKQKRLSFDPNMQTENPQILTKCGKPYKLYTIIFFLAEKPEVFNDGPKLNNIKWHYDFDGERIENTDSKTDGHGNKP